MKSKSVYYLVGFFFLVSCNKDKYPTPKIDSFGPSKGLSGAVVTITGSNFSATNSNNVVTFNGAAAAINKSAPDELEVVVPQNATTGKIKVSVFGSVGESTDAFTIITAPTIHSFDPSQGFVGSSVEIHGTGFSDAPAENVVKFGDAEAVIEAATTTTLTVNVPANTPSTEAFISVTTSGLVATCPAPFRLYPRIFRVEPISAPAGSTIKITGSGLKDVIVKFDDTVLKKISETSTQVQVVVPSQLVSISANITVTGLNNAVFQYPSRFTYVPSISWIRKRDFPGGARWKAISFAIGSKAYFGMGYTAHSSSKIFKDIWEYDPSIDDWTQKSDLPSLPGAAFSFALGGRGYVGVNNSISNLTKTWSYDPGTDSWSVRAEFGGVARALAATLVINDKAYVGCGGSNVDFWEYDPLINVWTRKADFLGEPRNSPSAFSLGTKGYLGTGAGSIKDFWEYDLPTNRWTQKAFLPFGLATNYAEHIGFAINSIGYAVGPDFCFRYDPQSDSWTSIDFPFTFNTAETAVVVNGKAYVLIEDQLWEFTPPK